MDKKSNIQIVLEGLLETQEACNELLSAEYPNLALRCNNQLGILIGQLSHAAGITLGASTTAAGEEKKPTHILGIALGIPPAPVKQEAITPSQEEKTQLQDLTDQAFADFQTLEAGVLKETYGDLIIRAVAVKADMEVTPTYPEKVNVAFIRDVIAAVKVKAEQIKQVEDADNASDNATGTAPVKQEGDDTDENAGANNNSNNENGTTV